jgi:CheY-like chemotaxis protein
MVLMDIRMPVMDGRTALQEIRKHEGMELLPVIAVTASGLPQDETDLRLRFSGYVRKPFSRATLHKELALFLPRSSTTAAVAEAAGSILESAPVAAMGGEELAAELKRLREKVWPLLRDSLAINDTLAFAAKLRELEGVTPGGKLGAYADRLTGYAETYAVRELEKCLDEFPALVAELEKSKN